MDTISQLEEDIKQLKIQGATKIALATLQGIERFLQEHKNDSDNSIYEIGRQITRRLAYARPTEPLAQNALRYIFSDVNKSSEFYLQKIQEYKELIQNAKEKQNENEKRLIQDGGVYLTHCHSSNVVSLFVEAWKAGKRFSLYATETRPKYQGRTTAQELIDAGVQDITMVIDDVAVSLLLGGLKHIDAVFIGADLLSKKGFVNKIGSLALAQAAKVSSIPTYCVTTLLKYYPGTFQMSMIEQRSGKEIWEDAPVKLKFYAPAFDYVVYGKYVKIVCEAGIVDGNNVQKTAEAYYPFLTRR